MYDRKFSNMAVTEAKTKETVKDVLALPFLDIPERKITKETCEKFGVRCAVSQQDGKTIEAIYFPFYDQKGKLTGFKKRDLTLEKEEKYHFTAVGSVKVSCKLFGQQVAEAISRKRGNVLYVEGEFDVLSSYQAQVESVAGTKYATMEPFIVGLSCGTANAVEATLHNEAFIKSFDSLTFGFDNDSATPAEKQKGIKKGIEARNDVAGALTGSGMAMFVVDYPSGCKDPSDMLQAKMSGQLAKLLQFDKRPYSAEKIIKASDILFEDLIKPRVEGVYVNCFPDLMRKIHGFRKRELVLVTSPSGVGKCHGKDTKILMADLSVKLVQDIQVGDKVMGVDGSPRNVLRNHRGIDMIYEVTQNKGESYTVNSEHILSLKSNVDIGSKGFYKDEVVNISVKDYIGLPAYCRKNLLKGYKADLTNLSTHSLDKDEAYILGLWLAEGTSAKPQFTLATKDKELHQQLIAFADKNKYRVNISPTNDRESSTGYDLAGGYLKYLRDYNVINNKHIPAALLLSDYSTRLNILAGFLDGDGYLINSGYEFTIKNNQLAKDIVVLARSLGLSVTHSEKFCKCQNFEGEIYIRIYVFGDTGKIPNRLPRKKANERRQKKDALRTGISIREIGIGDYFGFEVDGDNLYCLGDFTVTHNSTVTSIFASSLLEANQRVGMIYLEETGKETLQRMVASKLKVSYNAFKNAPLEVAKEEAIRAAYDSIVSEDKVVLLDHFGSLPVSELMNKIKHMHLVEHCDFIILDHISMVISATAVDNERKELDIVMTEIAAFCAANDVGIIAVSHINRSASADFKPPQGKEDKPFWVKITKEMMRGSSSLEQLSWVVLGLEPEILPDRSRGRVRLTVLKNRPWSYLGVADQFTMDDATWEILLSEDGQEF